MTRFAFIIALLFTTACAHTRASIVNDKTVCESNYDPSSPTIPPCNPDTLTTPATETPDLFGLKGKRGRATTLPLMSSPTADQKAPHFLLITSRAPFTLGEGRVFKAPDREVYLSQLDTTVVHQVTITPLADDQDFMLSIHDTSVDLEHSAYR